MTYTRKLKGFTLIELIVVIGIIAILSAIVIVAVNPARQFAQARNTTRRSDTNALLNAIHQYSADESNNGALPSTITTTAGNICTRITETPAAAACTAGLVDLSVIAPTYVTKIPKDPSQGAGDDSGYTVVKDANNRVTVAAPLAELGVTVEVER